jgi:2-octaprenyl-6-methoxyphenol hydroxylase
MSKERPDILICGAGAPGLTLALLLGRLGASVTLVERGALPSGRPGPADGRTSALMQGSVNIVKATGGWDAAAPAGEPLKTLRIVDDSKGGSKTVSVDFGAGEIGLYAFGINMPNAALVAALAAQATKCKNIRILAPATLSALEADAFGVTAAVDGKKIRARLAVGADGRQSAVRDLSGIGVKTHAYGQRAITCLIGHSRPHNNVSTEFHRPSGPFTLVPLPGNRSSVVWVDFDAEAESFAALSRHAFTRALQDRSKGLLGEIELLSAPSSWPLFSLKADRLIAPRVALIAEAAHVLHPLGAQGLNLSLRDAAVLAETVADALRLGQDPGSEAVLNRYEARRRHDLLSRVVGTDSLNRLVSNDLSLLKSLRQAGLRTIGTVPPLKRFAMRQGLAPALDGCRLARGEAL